MRKYLFILSIFSILIMTGCVATTIDVMKTPSAQISSLKGCTLTTVTYNAPGFSVVTPGKVATMALGGALFGGLGAGIGAGIADVSKSDVEKENTISDPAEKIALRLAPLIVDRFAVSSSDAVSARDPSTDDEKTLSVVAGNKGLVFDVKTLNWSIGYLRGDWSRYTVIYVVRARLIDAASGKIIGQVPCTYNSEPNVETAPTYDQLFENRAALLKTKLEAAVPACSDIIDKNIFYHNIN